MTRVVRFHQFGGPEVLQIEDLEVGPPGPGEARIAIQTIGLNRAEVAFRTGHYLEKANLPSRIGYEGSGIIEELGEGSSEFKVGDPVCILPTFSMNRYGVYADAAIVPVSSLIVRPKEVTEVQASALWMPYLTAFGALDTTPALQPGDAVIITAASSSVGLATIQVANRLGCVSIAVSRTNSKRSVLLSAGAQHVIAIAEENISDRVNQITDGRGARLIFDPIAGPGVADLAPALGQGGELIVYGNLSGRAHETPFPYKIAMQRAISMRGYFVVQDMANLERKARAIKFILAGLKDGVFAPAIDRVFALESIVQAHHYMQAGNQVGKIVVKAT